MAAETTAGPTDGSLRKRFLHLAWINILSTITVPLAGLVDTAMLGHLADIRFLAGVALAAVVFDFLYWTLGFLRMGATGTTAQAVGRGDHTEVYQVLYRFVLLGLALGGLLLVLQVPLREGGFALLSGTPEVEAAGKDYFNARIWAAPATLCNFAIVGWLLGREESRLVLVMTVAANLSNILFNYIFIIRLGLAAFGSGLATTVSQYVMLAVGVLIYLSRQNRVGFERGTVLDRHRLIEMLRLNRDILFRTLCLVATFAVFTNVSSIMGTAVLAANSLLLRLFTLAAYMIDGAAFATETLAGNLLGRRDLRGLRSLIRLSLITGTVFAALVLVAILAAPSDLLGLLTSHQELIDLSLRYVVWLLPVLLFGALAFMYDGLFLGLTEGRRLRNAMLASTLLVFMPPALIAAHYESPHLLWFALAAFMAARTATLAWATRSVLASYADGSPASAAKRGA